MAEEEKDKKVAKYAYKDVESAMKSLIKPNMAKVLAEQKLDISEFLPTIYANSSVLEGETIEQYALRCIDTSLALKMQENFKAAKIDNKKQQQPRETVIVEDEETKKPATESKEQADTGEEKTDDELAGDLEKKVVFGILGMPFKMLELLAEECSSLTTLTENGSMQFTKLTPEEMKSLQNYMTTIYQRFDEAMKLDGVDASSLSRVDGLGIDVATAKEEVSGAYAAKEATADQEKTAEEPVVDGESQEKGENKGTFKLSDGTEVSYGDYKAILEKIAKEPQIKARLKELGLSVEDIAGNVFGKVPALDGEKLDEYTLRTFDAYTTAKAVERAQEMEQEEGTKVDINKRPIKYASRNKEEEKVKGKGEEEKTSDPTFESLKEVLKFPFKFFKAILTGKTDEEMKAELDKTNLKDVEATLSPNIRRDLLRKIDKYQRDSFEVATKLGISTRYMRTGTKTKPEEQKPGQDKPAEQKPEQDKPAEEKPGQDKPAEEKPGQDKPTEEKPVEQEDKSQAEVTGPEGRRKIAPNSVRTREESETMLKDLIAEFDTLDLDDPVASMAWVSDVARLTDGVGSPIPEADRVRIVAKLEESRYLSDTKIKLPTYGPEMSLKARKAFILTATSRMLGKDGTGRLTMVLAKDAETIIAREQPELAHDELIYSGEAYNRNEPKVDRSKFSANDLAYQQKIDKLMKDFDGLDFNDQASVMKWMKDYGETAASMESVPDIDKAAMEKKLKESGIDTRIGSAKMYCLSRTDKEEASKWTIQVSVQHLLESGRIPAKVLDRIDSLTPEEQKEAQTTLPEDKKEGQEPLSEIGVNATKKVTQQTIDSGMRNKNGEEIINAINMDMHPELIAEMEEQRRQREEEAQVEDENSHIPSRPLERG